ncbi:MAG TPA: hypothetical protein VGK48_09120 [Terriglobia bacterium]
MAQIRPTYTKNVDEAGRLPYQHEVDVSPGSSACPSSSFCFVDFPAVPAGKRLVVQHITALVGVASGGQPNLFAFGDDFTTNTGNIAIIQPTFTQGPTILGANFWSLDKDITVYYEPGTAPRLKISASAGMAFVSNFTLHGYLIDAVN